MPQNVARRVAKEGINLVLIRIDWLHDLAPAAMMASMVVAALATMMYTSRPGSVEGERPGIHVPLTSPTVSSKAVEPSLRCLMCQPKACW